MDEKEIIQLIGSNIVQVGDFCTDNLVSTCKYFRNGFCWLFLEELSTVIDNEDYEEYCKIEYCRELDSLVAYYEEQEIE